MQSKNLGFLYACLAYLHWGLIPIYWKQIDHIDSVEIVLHRMVWAFVFVFALVLLLKQGGRLFSLLRNPALLWRLLIASLLIAFNWAVYIWAVNNEQMVEASMGYFINPLISVALGMLFFGERLRRLQMVSIILASCGVLYLILVFSKIPIIALTLAISFALYGAAKKSLSVEPLHGLTIETGFLVVPAALYAVYLGQTGQAAFGSEPVSDIFLVGAGIMTLIPLVLFSSAAQKISLTALGMLQYIGPSCQLLLAVFIYGEPFAQKDLVSFGLIWAALILFSLDQIRHQRNQRISKKKAVL